MRDVMVAECSGYLVHLLGAIKDVGRSTNTV